MPESSSIPRRRRANLPLTDWILRQHQIVIRDALIMWDDDLRNAPQLVLDRVQFRLENHFGRHRFGLKGTPPAELAAPLDLRGDLEFGSLSDWQNAQGRLFVRLDYADVAAWREWLPLPGQIATGTGAMRIWFHFARRRLREIVADLELADVKAKLARRPARTRARAPVGTRRLAQIRRAARGLCTQRWRSRRRPETRLDPAEFKLTVRDGPGAAWIRAIEFDQLQLAPLVALAAHLPLPDRIRADLARFAPRGTLTQGRLRWEGPAESPPTYAAAADFAQLGLAAQDAFPGATGLTGRFDATHDGGELRIASTNATLDLPRVLAAPIPFDTLQGLVKWERRDGTTTVRIEQLEFANADVAGDVTGTYRTLRERAGRNRHRGARSRGDARQVHRYLPRAIDPATRDWLRGALAGGSAVETRFTLAGNLADFPFRDGKGGKLLLDTKAKAVTLAYADGWPPIEAIDADVRIEGTRLTVDGVRGRVHSVEIGRTRVEIPDLDADRPLLRVDGDATGPIAGFLRFVSESPVATRTGKLTSAVEASGGGRLALKIELPLGRPDEIRSPASTRCRDAQLRFAGAPVLTKVNGKLVVHRARRPRARCRCGDPGRTREARVRRPARGRCD